MSVNFGYLLIDLQSSHKNGYNRERTEEDVSFQMRVNFENENKRDRYASCHCELEQSFVFRQ